MKHDKKWLVALYLLVNVIKIYLSNLRGKSHGGRGLGLVQMTLII